MPKNNVLFCNKNESVNVIRVEWFSQNEEQSKKAGDEEVVGLILDGCWAFQKGGGEKPSKVAFFATV